MTDDLHREVIGVTPRPFRVLRRAVVLVTGRDFFLTLDDTVKGKSFGFDEQ